MKYASSVIACALLVLASTGCSRSSVFRSRHTATQSEVVYTQSSSESSGSSNGAAMVNDVTFENEVSTAKVALVDFNARWCGPCRRMGPVIDALASEMAGEAKVMKCDIDESSQTADKFDVHSIPCLIVFKDGKEVERHYGVHTREEVKGWLATGDHSVSLAQ
jgi:thioredoxin 1